MSKIPYTVYFFNNCHNLDHVAYYGTRAFFDLGTSGRQENQARNLRPGQACVVVSQSSGNRVVFKWYSFEYETILPRDDGVLNRVFLGRFLTSEELPKSEAAGSARYSAFFNKNTVHFKTGSVFHKDIPLANRPVGTLESKKATHAPIDVEEQDLTDDEIDKALRANRLRIGIVPTDSQQGQVRQRRGQARIRKLTVENYGTRCAVCDVTDHALLIANHVVGWAEAPEHRGDLSNVICLCRIHDALFEAGYWSLGNRLGLLRKKSVASNAIRQVLDGMTSFRKPLEFPPALCFVKRHRERAGFEG